MSQPLVNAPAARGPQFWVLVVLILMTATLNPNVGGTPIDGDDPTPTIRADPPRYDPPAPLADVHRWYEPPEHAYGAGHRGIDFYFATGSQVRSPASGNVTFAGLVAGRPVLVIQHADGLRSTLEPIDSWLAVGDHVSLGEAVGTLRIDGSHCLPRSCLHWGVRRGSDYVDPMSLISELREIRLVRRR